MKVVNTNKLGIFYTLSYQSCHGFNVQGLVFNLGPLKEITRMCEKTLLFTYKIYIDLQCFTYMSSTPRYFQSVSKRFNAFLISYTIQHASRVYCIYRYVCTQTKILFV